MNPNHRVSHHWNCEEDAASWIAYVAFVRVETSDVEERIMFYRLFRENGLWKTNDNNEWGNAFAEYVNNNILNILNIPQSLVKAMLATVVNDLSIRIRGGEEPAIMTDIKDMYRVDEFEF
jgi:hypothetical protein